jgi:hypothetical protein
MRLLSFFNWLGLIVMSLAMQRLQNQNKATGASDATVEHNSNRFDSRTQNPRDAAAAVEIRALLEHSSLQLLLR